MKSHITVLLEEAVSALKLQPDSVVVDATYGAGGHAAKILELLNQNGTYVGIDVDATALQTLPPNPNEATVHLINDNFKNITNSISSLHTINSIDAILADLGWRMEQFEASGKGLSFQYDEPLAMTYGNPDVYDFAAYDIVNTWEEDVLADIIFGYGEERAARRIAKAIVEARSVAPIATTFELANLIKNVVRQPRTVKTHPATKTFQALRIAVNDELQVLETFINAAFNLLTPNGRLAIITFHSLEDRIVKHQFRSLAATNLATVVTKKPIVPTEDEVKDNPRARSAKLRVLQKHNVEQHEQNTTITKQL